MSDKFVALVEKELDRMHELLLSSEEGSLEYDLAINGIERLQCCLLPESTDIVEDTITSLLKNAPTGDAQ